MFHHLFVLKLSSLAGSRILLCASHRSTQFSAIVSLRLKPVLERKLARKDKRVGRSKTALARGASVSWLHEQEKIRIAEERFARLEAGQSRTYSLAEVKRELVL
jgi:predicted DNA-binding protein